MVLKSKNISFLPECFRPPRIWVPSSGLLFWIGGIIAIAFMLYQLLFFLKGMLIALMEKGYLLWLLLFLICVSFTCILPAWLAWEPAIHLAAKVKSDASFARMTVIILVAYGYTRYNFLERTAPPMAAGAFSLGFELLSLPWSGKEHRTTNHSLTLRPIKSQRLPISDENTYIFIIIKKFGPRRSIVIFISIWPYPSIDE
jgi:hypothetical protein